jgi:6 kDa early secretory antigenic target
MSGGTYIKVNFGALQAAVGDLDRAIGQIDAKLGDLHRQAQPLVATWEGGAQAAYNERHTAWTKSADELKAVLMSIKKALTDSLAEYAATEAGIEKSFR